MVSAVKRTSRRGRPRNQMPPPADLFIRIVFADGSYLGPGKVELLELVGAHGSIAAAGKAMGMSYKRAWDLIDEINRMFDNPAVAKQHGGSAGGGAALTEDGRAIVEAYRSLEREAAQAASPQLGSLLKARRRTAS